MFGCQNNFSGSVNRRLEKVGAKRHPLLWLLGVLALMFSAASRDQSQGASCQAQFGRISVANGCESSGAQQQVSEERDSSAQWEPPSLLKREGLASVHAGKRAASQSHSRWMLTGSGDGSYRFSFLSRCSVHGRGHLHLHAGAVWEVLLCGRRNTLRVNDLHQRAVKSACK